jgi:AcrR family transcriptional regulator
VIEAARVFFADRGYGPATNNLIAEAAGVTSGALYYHFGSKGDLFAAVCDDSFDSIYQRYASEITEPLDIRGLLRQLLVASMKLNREQPSLAGFVATAPLEARRYPELAGAVARHVERRDAVLADLIKAGQQAALIRGDVDAARAAALVGLLLHGFADSAAQVTADELEEQADLFNRLIDGGLVP